MRLCFLRTASKHDALAAFSAGASDTGDTGGGGYGISAFVGFLNENGGA